jgi:HPt (histidine-containing phosphotransfer) domain-containing protein
MAEPEVIDAAAFQQLFDSVGGDREFLGELLQTYFDDAPALLATMQSAVSAGNTEALRRAAHSLKSNSASFGAMSLSGLCKSVEDMAKTGTLDGAGVQIAAAEKEYARVVVRLKALSG